MITRYVVAFLATLSFAACGGGGGNSPAIKDTETDLESDTTEIEMESDSGLVVPEPNPDSPSAELLPFPLPGFNCLDHYGEGTDCDAYRIDTFDQDNIPTYQIDALPLRTQGDDGLHMPIYHDHSQLFGIGVHDWGDNQRRIFVGADRGESVGHIPAAGSRGSIKLRHGLLADGVASAQLRAFLVDALGTRAARYETAPAVEILGSPRADEVNWIVAAIELVNAALPTDFRMRIGDQSDHTITVEFRPEHEFDADTGGNYVEHAYGRRDHCFAHPREQRCVRKGQSPAFRHLDRARTDARTRVGSCVARIRHPHGINPTNLPGMARFRRELQNRPGL